LLRGLAAPGRRRRLAVAAAVAAGALVLLLLVALGSGGDAATRPPATSGATGTVARRTLAERLTATGTIGYAGEATVFARLSGTVTALPAVGDVVRRGEPLYSLGAEPVLLMYGSAPAYRTLADGISRGKDVEQLEANLTALGYEPGAVDEEFTSATTEAVSAWQEDLGLEASGEVELGRVAFLRGPQRVTKLEATLGEAFAGAGTGSVPVLRTSSTRRVVRVDLEADQQSIAHRGQRVRVLLPSGAEVPGEVTGLTHVEASPRRGGPAGEGGKAGVVATIALADGRRIPALDGASVDIRFTQQVRRKVLSVPLTALVAIGGGRFAVHVLEGAAGRQLVVAPGLAADGYVEVEGKGLEAGMRVETGE
jgi:multidrug efflux pump subunit AcrA (membrane-fusion protein)